MAQRRYPAVFIDPSTNEEYRILQQLSLKKSSAVFKAVGPQGDVALQAWFAGNLHLFRGDNKIRSRFQHHRVLSIRAIFQHEGYSCQVFPWCAKQSVRDVANTKRRKKFDELEARVILQQVAVVMAEMHDEDRLHGSIRPSSILLDEDDRVLVDNFCNSERGVGNPFVLCGNRRGNQNYMSPERLVTPHRFGKAADVWAFGILMFEMLVGRLPERNDETHEVQFGDDLEGLSQKAIKLIRSLLSPNPDNRLNFNEILQAPFIRSEEQDQGVQNRKKKESQQDVSQVTDTAT
ncbi:MAG: kinase-like domain-containing protein [Linnemannia gamsii]|nr:MAG: kinase-like domain-containing protein [Linnemannia gamsii]